MSCCWVTTGTPVGCCECLLKCWNTHPQCRADYAIQANGEENLGETSDLESSWLLCLVMLLRQYLKPLEYSSAFSSTSTTALFSYTCVPKGRGEQSWCFNFMCSGKNEVFEGAEEFLGILSLVC